MINMRPKINVTMWKSFLQDILLWYYIPNNNNRKLIVCFFLLKRYLYFPNVVGAHSVNARRAAGLAGEGESRPQERGVRLPPHTGSQTVQMPQSKFSFKRPKIRYFVWCSRKKKLCSIFMVLTLIINVKNLQCIT